MTRHVTLRGLRSALLSIALTTTPAIGQEISSALPDPKPRSAIDFIVQSFDGHDLVALSEAHDCTTEHEFLRALIRDPGFREVCLDIVVEFASARYQGTIDRYLSGEEVPFEELSLAWRNTPVSPFQTWDSPVYAEFLRTVRETNQGQPASSPMRIWASEEPIDWDAITTADEHYPFLERSVFPARMTWEKALATGRKTLLLRGGGHLTRSPKGQPVRRDRRNVLQVLIDEHGVDPLTIGLWADSGGNQPDVERRLGEWSAPAIATIGGTWMGNLPATGFFQFVVQDADGNWGPPFVGVAIEELFDAYLYLGPSDQIRYAEPDPATYTAEYRAELNRRRTIFGMSEVFEEIGAANEEGG